jgi:hypothetical protein
MRHSNYIGVFYTLLQAGLWEKDVQLLQYGWVDYKKVMQLAEEQSVVGLVTAGLEHVIDTKIPHDKLIPFIGRTLQIEQRNKAMNEFIAKLINLLNENGVKALLVKGQGVAQCYDRPLWRAYGDVDLLLDDENYQKAKESLSKIATNIEQENIIDKHCGFVIGKWIVELHGTLHCGLYKRIDKFLDKLAEMTFTENKVRCWNNDKVEVEIPCPDNDIIFIFTHILQHFYKEGVGLRQICDWCRLLWTYRDSINKELLEKRIRKMGLMSEWKAFAAFAIDYLGMPVEATPLLNNKDCVKFNKKVKRINDFILEVGNMGHNRDMSYFDSKSYLTRKFLSFKRRIKDIINHTSIFPLATLKFTPTIMFNGIVSAIRGE